MIINAVAALVASIQIRDITETCESQNEKLINYKLVSTFNFNKTITGRLWGEKWTHQYTGSFGGVEGFEDKKRWGTICDDGFNEEAGQQICAQIQPGSKFLAFSNSIKYSHFANGSFPVLHQKDFKQEIPIFTYNL